MPPSVQISPVSVGGFTGLEVQLTCTVSGDPEPTVTWQFEGSSLLPLPTGALANGNTLTVVVGDETAGTYDCEGSNAAGTSQASAVVYLESKRL